MAKQKKSTPKDLLTLSEVAKRTGISMPSLLRYKKRFQDRIPAVGKGRKQRYPETALAAFEAIKNDNLKRRGRPKGSGSGRASKGRRGGARAQDVLSLNEIARRTNISYPTLLRYVQNYLPQLPHQGSGRTRRFMPEAVEVFQRLRSESRRGRRKAEAVVGKVGRALGAGGEKFLLKRLDQIEQMQRSLAQQLRDLAKAIDKPLRIVVKR